ncbi:preprotein translocase subunit SecG [uncultured Campylobacter sp.]|uniref:preprotein translocase subunit SecG n=1 Tax=uncultured Campylobacter sp. TaxID=218934 RepID=UPI00260F834E|nr:preprotein translocase subunit SecG [uncultured Campylobacter sp.]
MTTLFLVLQVVFAVIITISVLLQKSSSIGLGAYSGSNESLFGAKGPAGFLAKFTAAMGILFVINTLVLAYFYQQDAKSSVVDRVKIEANATKSVPNAVPGVPSIPNSGTKPNFAPANTEANPVNSSEVNSTALKIEAPVAPATDTAAAAQSQASSAANDTNASAASADQNTTK